MTRMLCGNLVNEYYVRKFRAIARERSQRINALKTKAEALNYIAGIRTKIRSVFPFGNMEKTPLKAQVISTVETENIRCEKILFESLPDYPVTCNLYLPRTITGKIPAVLHLCGHNLTGKINKNGKALNLALAAGGMAVLTLDPLDQGERFRNPVLPGSQNVRGHNLIGKRLIGCGSWFGVWRTWDAVRGLDYLFSRQEIDPERVYATGCSGGGTMTAMLNAVEDRLAGAVPSCYITSWKYNVANELPVDAEQVPPFLSAQGLEMGDLLIAAAPRPIQISGEEDDIFDPRGTREVFREIQKIYQLLDCEDQIRLFMGPNGHGYWQEQREACCKFLFELAGHPAKDIVPATLPDIPDEQLRVLNVPTVFDLPDAKSADQRLKEELNACEKMRQKLSDTQLLEQTAACLKIKQDIPLPDYRVLRPDVLSAPFFARFLLEDGELPLGILYFTEIKNYPSFPENVFLYIPHWDYRQEISTWMLEFPDWGCTSFDPVLIGEMQPVGCDLNKKQFGEVYSVNYHYAACSLMLDQPVAGISVAGILAALKLIREGGAKNIILIGAGQSSVTTLFAAFLGRSLITKTILINALPSYAALFDTPNPICPQSLIVPGYLKIADLPDLYRIVQPELRRCAAFPCMTDPV